MFVRAYLRASTTEQDASLAKADLDGFVAERGLRIAAYYVENESGASLRRPELFRLLSDCHAGDVLLIEQVDRLSRLDAEDWESLKRELQVRKVRVVALDLPTSWMMTSATDKITARLMDALNGMMLDMLAAIARKDYTDRRRRQQQGIEKLKAEGGYKGRKEDVQRNEAIMTMLRRGDSWNHVIAATGCSRSTLARLAQRVREALSPPKETKVRHGCMDHAPCTKPPSLTFVHPYLVGTETVGFGQVRPLPFVDAEDWLWSKQTGNERRNRRRLTTHRQG